MNISIKIIEMSKIIEFLEEDYEFEALKFIDELILSDSVEKLDLNPGNMIHSIDSIARDIFGDGVNWGRIIYFFCFLKKLVGYHQMGNSMRSEVIRLTRDSKKDLLDEWIEDNGGQKVFHGLFGK